MGALVRYHGGKVRIADKIVGLFPRHDCYVEPFGGGAAVLLSKPRARVEVYNDLDGDMVALFRALRDSPEDLAAAVAATPFAREEYERAYSETDDDIERARRVLVKSHFAHGGGSIHASSHRRSGFRGVGLREGPLPVHGWMNMPATVRIAAERMRGVIIEQRPAVDVMAACDRPDVVHYIDPPYLPETRSSDKRYRHEMTVAEHEEMLRAVRGLRGSVVLSGYASALYDEALHGWRRIEIKTRADRAVERTEVLWCNFEDAPPLFAESR